MKGHCALRLALLLFLLSAVVRSGAAKDAASLPPAGVQTLPLTRTDPQHLPAPPTPESFVDAPLKRAAPDIATERIVLERLDLSVSKAGTFDPVLSNSCAIGDFLPRPGLRLMVQMQDALLLAIRPQDRARWLYDRRQRIRPNETYLFLDAGTARCRVWMREKVPPRRLDPQRGTSVPPVTDADRRKKLEMISRWPGEGAGK